MNSTLNVLSPPENGCVLQVTTASEAELALQERADEGLSRDVERFEKKVELEKEARLLFPPLQSVY